MNGIEQRYF